LINARDSAGGSRAFGRADENYARILADYASPRLEQSMMTARTVRRMLSMIETHSGRESVNHATRVASCAAEIFHEWATRRGMPEEERAAGEDLLRPAAMVHDAGLVAVPENILQKPSALTPKEYEIVKTHAAKGATVFAGLDDPFDKAAFEIALNHHQRWDGEGYTGSPDFPVLAGEDIPVFARITAAADALDAIISPRPYRKSWTFAGGIEQLKQNAGTQFDPEVVDVAVEIQDTLRAVFRRFTPPPGGDLALKNIIADNTPEPDKAGGDVWVA
jgi:HD-GYP domain-containing protein (c-di-GMP phosphodiesterase class II)